VACDRALVAGIASDSVLKMVRDYSVHRGPAMQLGKDITAVVTGGASGLGAGTARALAMRGVKVALFDLNADKGQALAKEIGAEFFSCDVTSEASIDAALAAARAALGPERVLVNCAGIAVGQRLTRKNKETGAVTPHDLATFARVIQINLTGTFLMLAKCAAQIQTLAPVGPDGERGVMINTASVAATDGQIGQVAYSASKGGVLGMTLPIARDLAQFGIRVCTIMPGLFQTPMFDTLPPEAQQALGAATPFPSRLGRPDEYAALACHICENSMLNGEAIRLDGAIRLAPR
jgi:NAD(P)-dependent dehydrogenase (short-subunit alcohol dehydrogenase family)